MNCGRVLLAFCFISTLAIVEAIRCYQCESHIQKGCFPLNTSLVPLTDCPYEAVSCNLLRMDAQFQYAVGEKIEPSTRYIRSCSTEKSETQYSCLERSGTGTNSRSVHCICNSDGYNPAGRIAMMGSGAIAALALLLFNLA